MDALDTYGSIVKVRGSAAELRSLALELMSVDSRRPEAWAVAAMASDLASDKARALEQVQHALALDRRHVFAHLLRGALLIARGEPAEASESFAASQALTNDLSVFQGLVQANMMLEKFDRALHYAQEAYRRLPRNPRALTLVGLVLSCDNDQRRKARRVFEQALALRPYWFDF